MTRSEYNAIRNNLIELRNKLYTEEHNAQAANDVPKMLELLAIESWLCKQLNEFTALYPETIDYATQVSRMRGLIKRARGYIEEGDFEVAYDDLMRTKRLMVYLEEPEVGPTDAKKIYDDFDGAMTFWHNTKKQAN